MNYSDDRKIMVGDKLVLWGNSTGVVVCSFDDGVFSKKFPKSDWFYLKKGILVESITEGVIHIEDSEPSFKLIERE